MSFCHLFHVIWVIFWCHLSYVFILLPIYFTNWYHFKRNDITIIHFYVIFLSFCHNLWLIMKKWDPYRNWKKRKRRKSQWYETRKDGHDEQRGEEERQRRAWEASKSTERKVLEIKDRCHSRQRRERMSELHRWERRKKIRRKRRFHQRIPFLSPTMQSLWIKSTTWTRWRRRENQCSAVARKQRKVYGRISDAVSSE